MDKITGPNVSFYQNTRSQFGIIEHEERQVSIPEATYNESKLDS